MADAAVGVLGVVARGVHEAGVRLAQLLVGVASALADLVVVGIPVVADPGLGGEQAVPQVASCRTAGGPLWSG